MKHLAALVISISLFGSFSGNSTLKTDNTCQISTSECTYINQLAPKENINYVYDHLGRIILQKSNVFKRTYAYSNSEIIEKYEDGRKNLIVVCHKLDAMGRIVSSIEPSIRIQYSYGENGYLYLAKTTYSSDANHHRESRYTIADGNLKRIEKNDDGELDTVMVSSSMISFPANFHYLIRDLPFEFTGPLRRYYGKPLKNLIAKTKTSGLSPVFYRYKKNALGNVVQVQSKVTYEKTETDLINMKYNCK